jgi:hypothetical protein
MVAELAGLSDAELAPFVERLAPLLAAAGASRPAREVSPYMTVAEAAVFLCCAPKRVYNLRSEGRLTRAEEGGRALLLRVPSQDGRRGAGGPAATGPAPRPTGDAR